MFYHVFQSVFDLYDSISRFANPPLHNACMNPLCV
jgi:hypothetical protein